MGAAFMYFTSGMTFRCDSPTLPTPGGLRMAYDPGNAFFFFHLFAALFVYLGLWNFYSYLWYLADRLRARYHRQEE